MDTLQLDLDVVLPSAHDARDRCVADLVGALSRLDGVDSVHVLDDSPDECGDRSAKVCLHLASGAVSISRLNDRIRATGAEIDSRYGHALLSVGSVGHASRARALSERLRALDGVIDGAISIEGIARIEFDRTRTSERDVVDELRSIGLHATPLRNGSGDGAGETTTAADSHGADGHDDSEHRAGHDHDHGSSRVELGAALISLVIYLVARSLDWFTDIDQPVTWLYVAAALLTGVFVARDALLSVQARVFDIDQLMLIAAIGAASIGHWSDSALLLVLFSLGHARGLRHGPCTKRDRSIGRAGAGDRSPKGESKLGGSGRRVGRG